MSSEAAGYPAQSTYPTGPEASDLSDQAAVQLYANPLDHSAVVQMYPGVVPSVFDQDLVNGLRDADGNYFKSNRIIDPSTICQAPFHGLVQYVITEDGELILGDRSKEARWAHPNLIGGKDPQVLAAGEIKFSNSIPFAMNSRSGHFQPPADTLDLAKAVIAKIFNCSEKLIVGGPDLDLMRIVHPAHHERSSFNAFGDWMPSAEFIKKLATANDPSAPQLDEKELMAMFSDPQHRLFNHAAHKKMKKKGVSAMLVEDEDDEEDPES